MFNKSFEILNNEKWWGGVIQHSHLLPFTRDTIYEVDLGTIFTNNQVSCFYISSEGRYIYSNHGFTISFNKGIINIESTFDVVIDKENSFITAYYKVANEFFVRSKNELPDNLFTIPQFNTWIKFMYEQNESGILEYAKEILTNGFKAGELIIDCGWQEYYGLWNFHPGRFKNPKLMVEKLHKMGFKVVLWYVPFICLDSIKYREYLNKNLLIKKDDSEPLLVKWWDGYSAVMDLTNPETIAEIKNIFSSLINEYGVDGFKLDAGDLVFYDENSKTFGSSLPEEQTKAYAELAESLQINELRSCFNFNGASIVQRAADRHHCWDKYNGLQSLIPISCLQNLMGYFYSCPDMVGGGDFSSFLNNQNLDKNLFIRYSELASLMPMIQFSYDYWNLFDAQTNKICTAYGQIREDIKDYFLKLKHNAYKNFDPIICYPEFYGYNNLDCDAFCFGNDVIVAPIVKENSESIKINLPNGKWNFYGKILDGGIYVIEVPIYMLPIFIKNTSNVNIHEAIMKRLSDYDFNVKVEKL